jgi:2-dehydropantoate 2-reductase
MTLERPKVVIAGSGAMGGLFGGLLAEGGLEVVLLDVWREHIVTIARDGLRIVGVGGDRTVRVAATADAASIAAADVVLIQCKAYATEAAARSIAHLIGGGAVAISFQNGLGNEETIGRLVGAQNVLAGLTAQAGLVEAPGVVRNFGDLPTWIGELEGGLSPRAVAIAAAFSRHGLPVQASADIKRDKWKKLLANVSLSAVSGITDLHSMGIMSVPALRPIVFAALDEAAAVAAKVGIELDPAQAREVLNRLTTAEGGGTGTAKSSLCADLRRRRPTEVDAIYGSVARLGRTHGVPTPTIDILIGLVKGIESTYLGGAKS